MGGCGPPTEHHGGGRAAAHGGHCYGEGLERSVSYTLLCVFDFLVKRIHFFYNIKSQQRNRESKEKSENRQNHLETHQRPLSHPREASQIANTQNASGRSYSSFPQSSPDRPVFHQITSDKSHIPSSSALQPPRQLPRDHSRGPESAQPKGCLLCSPPLAFILCPHP